MLKSERRWRSLATCRKSKGETGNTFYHGDCKFVMKHDILQESVDLIYIVFVREEMHRPVLSKEEGEHGNKESRENYSSDWPEGANSGC